MRRIVHSAGLVIVLLLAFVLQQTGAARIAADPCSATADDHAEDQARGCAEQGEEHCPPSCADCSGCPGPARGLVAETSFVHVVPLVGTLPPSWIAAPAGFDPHLRLDRPPRS